MNGPVVAVWWSRAAGDVRELARALLVEAALAERLAAYKRPRRMHVLARMPRTTTGKLVRDRAVLRQVGREEGSVTQ